MKKFLLAAVVVIMAIAWMSNPKEERVVINTNTVWEALYQDDSHAEALSKIMEENTIVCDEDSVKESDEGVYTYRKIKFVNDNDYSVKDTTLISFEPYV